MIEISKAVETFLIKEGGYPQEDLQQIKESYYRCKYEIAHMPKDEADMTTHDYDELQYRRCSRRRALDTLGWQSFWLGLGRAAFHGSTTRNKGTESISFTCRW